MRNTNLAGASSGLVVALALISATTPPALAGVGAPPQSARQQSADRGLTRFYFDRERDAKGERAQGDRHLAQTLIGDGCQAVAARFAGPVQRGGNLYAVRCASGGRQWVQTRISPEGFCALMTDAAGRRGGAFVCEPTPPSAQ